MDLVLPLLTLGLGALVMYFLRTRKAERQAADLEERHRDLERRAARSEAAAGRADAAEQEQERLRERNTALEKGRAAAEAELRSARESSDSRIRDLNSRLITADAQARDLSQQLDDARQHAGKAESALASERESHEARLEELRGFGKEIERKFGALSTAALEQSNKTFLQLVSERFEQHKEAAERDLGERQKQIGNLVRPLGDTLRNFRKTVDEIERDRVESRGKLDEQVRSLRQGQENLSSETSRLVQALRKPQTRGRWGEVQLERVLEMAGMVRNHDFEEQQQVEGGKRPDLILRLPGGRAIVVDAKTPLAGYLDAVQANTDDERQRAEKAHAEHVRNHVKNLASKEYWNGVPESVDLVVMFLPGEAIFARAIETAPDLLDFAVNNRILISTPTTFIALAKAIAYGWRQERMADKSTKIAELGRELFKRLTKFADHLQKTGKSLEQTVIHYNKGVGSFDHRLIPQANRFEELHVVPSGTRLEPIGPVSTRVSQIPRSEADAALTDDDHTPMPALPQATGPTDATGPSDKTTMPTPAPASRRRPAQQQILDDMLGLIRRIEPEAERNPKKAYVGLLVEGRPRNFVRFKKRRSGILAVLRLPAGEPPRAEFDDRSLGMRIDSRGHTVVTLTPEAVANHADFLLDLLRRARDAYRRPGRRRGA